MTVHAKHFAVINLHIKVASYQAEILEYDFKQQITQSTNGRKVRLLNVTSTGDGHQSRHRYLLSQEVLPTDLWRSDIENKKFSFICIIHVRVQAAFRIQWRLSPFGKCFEQKKIQEPFDNCSRFKTFFLQRNPLTEYFSYIEQYLFIQTIPDYHRYLIYMY